MAKGQRGENLKALKSAHEHCKKAFGEVAYVYERFEERPGEYKIVLEQTLDAIKCTSKIISGVYDMF